MKLSTFKPFLLLLPAIVVIAFVTIYPFIYAIYLSLIDFDLTNPMSGYFVGGRNYIEILSSKRFWHSIQVTFLFVGASVGVEFLLGFGLASLLNRPFVGKNIIIPLLYLPMMVAPVVIGLNWRMLYDPTFGPLNYFLQILGVPPLLWHTGAETALLSVVLTDIWEWTPFMFLLMYAGLLALPMEVYEAAKIDGTGRMQELLYITLPLMRPIITVAVLIRAIDAFKEFDKIYMLTMGGPGIASEVLTYLVYQRGFREFDMSRAASMSIILFIVVFMLSRAFINTFSKQR